MTLRHWPRRSKERRGQCRFGVIVRSPGRIASRFGALKPSAFDAPQGRLERTLTKPGAGHWVFLLSLTPKPPVRPYEPVRLPAFGQLSTTDLTVAYRANMVSDLPSPQMSKEVSLWLTA